MTITMLRTFWKKNWPKILRNFPEHKEVLDTVQFGCCSIPKEVLKTMARLVQSNPDKWKKVFGEVDKIQLYDGERVIIL